VRPVDTAGQASPSSRATNAAVLSRAEHYSALTRGLGLFATVTACVLLPALMAVANKSAPAALGVAAVSANAALLVSGGFGTLLVEYRRTFRSGVAVVLAALALVSLASLFWSIDPAMTRRGLIEAVPELVFGWTLAAAWPRLLRPTDLKLLAFGVLAGSVLIGFEFLLGMPLHRLLRVRAEAYDLKRSAIPLVLLLWPTLQIWAGRRPRWFAPVLVLAVVAAGLISHSAASIVAVVLGLLIFVAGKRWPRAILYAALGLSLALLVATPWMGTLARLVVLPPFEQRLSGQHAAQRIQIWSTFERHIRDKHLIGHGFDTSFRLAATVETQSRQPGDAAIENIHPHNALLQVWIEFGVLGAILTSMALAFVFVRLASYGPEQRAYRLGFLAAAATVALVGLNAWSPWWLAVLALSLVLFGIDRREHPRADPVAV
jgi:hypothetical protein